MNFIDAVFFGFLACVFALHALVRGKEAKLGVLLGASLVFYGWWDWRFLALISFVIGVSWISALRATGRRAPDWRRHGVLIAALGGLWAGLSLLTALDLLPVLRLPGGYDPGADVRVLVQGSWAVAAITVAAVLFARILAARAPQAERRGRFWTGFAIAALLGTLALFKYAGFFAASAADFARLMGVEPGWTFLHILLPVGISFYIFQAISYVVDVARGRMAPAERLSRVALYIAFFPQLVAGPIVRAASFFPQMERRRRQSGAVLAAGLRAFLLGLAYKAGIADHLAPLVDPVFGDALKPGDADLSAWSNGALVGATLAFAGQIYFDFAGYSLMAIGVARGFGFWIPRNFAYPYSAASLQEFWRRWHISLSSWLRDYVYIPLGGSRQGGGLTARNLMLTMLLGGLWHGAAWTFVIWGALHGAGLVAGRVWRIRLGFWPGLVLTQAFVLFTWVAFRAEDFSDMLSVWAAMTGLREGGAGTLSPIVLAVPVLIALDAWLGRRRRRARAQSAPLAYWAGLGMLLALLLALYPLKAAPFVYFQF